MKVSMWIVSETQISGILNYLMLEKIGSGGTGANTQCTSHIQG